MFCPWSVGRGFVILCEAETRAPLPRKTIRGENAYECEPEDAKIGGQEKKEAEGGLNYDSDEK